MPTFRRIKNSIVTFAAVGGMLLIPAVPILSNTVLARAAQNASYVTLSSFSGNPGTSILVSGGNFGTSEIVSVVATENGGQVATATGNANQYGQFTTTLNLPDKLSQGAVAITATGVSSGLSSSNSYYVTPFAPQLITGSGSTTPFGTLTVSGSGYAPNETVDLNLAGATAKVVANTAGAFSGATITTPDVPAASYTVIGAGELSGASAVAYEYINGFYPNAAPTSYYVLPATTLGFNGSGFAPNETVTVTSASNAAILSTFKVTATGSFTNAGDFTVPAADAGLSEKFVLTGSLSQASTTVTSTIGNYFPNVSPSVYYTMPGTTVSFNGSGFIPGETVDVDNGLTKLTTTVANAKGNIALGGTVTVPVSAAGTTQTYTLVGETSHGSSSVSVQIGSYNPVASPSSYYAMPGSIVTFTGSGYAPSEVVAVFNGLTNVSSITTDATGSFLNAGGVTIAYNQAGVAQKFTLTGGVSKTNVNLTIGVGQLNTQLSPSSYYVLPFALFNVTATGFAPSETVTLTNGPTVLGTATTTPLGTATFSGVTLPPNAKGSDTLTATGTTSAATATVSIGLGNYNPSLTSSNYYVQPGTTVTLSGTGYAPGEGVTVTAGTTSVLVTADAKGNFTTPFVVPFGQTTSSINIVASGVKSGASVTTALTLAPYNTQVTPSTYYATPSTPISFTGSGFVPGESIAVTLNGTSVGTETANAMGNLKSTGVYALPYGKAAVFTFTGTKSSTVNTLNIGLAQFYAGLQLSSYYGNGGSTVTATGSGFAPNELIRIQSGTTTLEKGAANALGNFSYPIQIPYSAPGKVSITATGSSSGASATTTYTAATVYTSVQMGNYAPKAGTAVNFIGSGYFAGEPVTITTDRGGISYGLNASATGTFNDSGLVLPATLAPGNLTFTIYGTESFTTQTITIYVQSAN